MAEQIRYYGTGKRKNAIARIYVRPRKGEMGMMNVNGRSLENYFPRPALQKIAMQSLDLIGTNGQYDIYVNVKGGGISAQASAIRHGIARVFNEMDEAQYRATLKKAGFKNVKALWGGWSAWEQAGYATEPK